jgi:hypothetical protein
VVFYLINAVVSICVVTFIHEQFLDYKKKMFDPFNDESYLNNKSLIIY